MTLAEDQKSKKGGEGATGVGETAVYNQKKQPRDWSRYGQLGEEQERNEEGPIKKKKKSQ